MTSDLIKALRVKVALDHYQYHGMPHRGPDYWAGCAHENARLKPILSKLIAVVEAASISALYQQHELTEALADLRAAVREKRGNEKRD